MLEETEIDMQPFLVAYDHFKRAIWTLEVEQKGVEAGVCTQWLVDRLEFAGYSGVKVTPRASRH